MSLKGKVIVITRPEKQANELAELISDLGGKPYKFPTIAIKPAANASLINQFIKKIFNEQIAFLIFMSISSVTILISYLDDIKLKEEFLRKLSKTTIIAIGPKTKRELEKYGIRVDFIPEQYSSEGIIKIFKKIDLQNKIVAIPRAYQSSEYLVQELTKLGSHILEVPIYKCIVPKDLSKTPVFVNDLVTKKIDAITFTSPSTAINLFKIVSDYISLDKLRKYLEKIVVIAIGPTTKKALEGLGIKVDLVPKDYTIEGMLDSFVRYLQ